MEAIDKKIIISAYEYSYKIEEAVNTIEQAVSYLSSLLLQPAADLESLGHMTWKILKKLQLFYINKFMLSLMAVPKSVTSDSEQHYGR